MIDANGNQLFTKSEDKDFFEELRALSTDENPCDYFVVAAFKNGTAGVFSTAIDPKLISHAFQWGVTAIDNPEEAISE